MTGHQGIASGCDASSNGQGGLGWGMGEARSDSSFLDTARIAQGNTAHPNDINKMLRRINDWIKTR